MVEVASAVERSYQSSKRMDESERVGGCIATGVANLDQRSG